MCVRSHLLDFVSILGLGAEVERCIPKIQKAAGHSSKTTLLCQV